VKYITIALIVCSLLSNVQGAPTKPDLTNRHLVCERMMNSQTMQRLFIYGGDKTKVRWQRNIGDVEYASYRGYSNNTQIRIQLKLLVPDFLINRKTLEGRFIDVQNEPYLCAAYSKADFDEIRSTHHSNLTREFKI
jgi:hypothetical protein